MYTQSFPETPSRSLQKQLLSAVIRPWSLCPEQQCWGALGQSQAKGKVPGQGQGAFRTHQLCSECILGQFLASPFGICCAHQSGCCMARKSWGVTALGCPSVLSQLCHPPELCHVGNGARGGRFGPRRIRPLRGPARLGVVEQGRGGCFIVLRPVLCRWSKGHHFYPLERARGSTPQFTFP